MNFFSALHFPPRNQILFVISLSFLAACEPGKSTSSSSGSDGGSRNSAADSRLITTMPGGFSFVVLNAEVLNEWVGSLGFMQSGRVVRKMSELQRLEDFCEMRKSEAAFEFRNGDAIIFPDVLLEGAALKSVSRDLKLKLSCFKQRDKRVWTSGEILPIFGSTIESTILK